MTLVKIVMNVNQECHDLIKFQKKMNEKKFLELIFFPKILMNTDKLVFIKTKYSVKTSKKHKKTQSTG